MKTFVLAYILPVAHSLIVRRSSCCFDLTATGGPGGIVGQLADGQNRIGQGLAGAKYCINNGGVTDGNGRGCILTPPTTQWQCDSGAVPTGGFTIDCNGELEYNGTSVFWSCPTGDHGGYNIYETPPAGQAGCVTVTLKSDSCYTACSTKNCGTALTSGNYEFPHLIIPINSAAPNTAYGTQYNGEVSSTISTIFNFDIPWSDAGKTCSLVFDFPTQAQLQTSSFTFSGAGTIDFSQLVNTATQSTDYANAPAMKTDYGTFTVTPGTNTVIATFACPAGTAVAYEMKAVDNTYLTYFQDYNPSPIGIYITKC